jgi:hypothetical protein
MLRAGPGQQYQFIRRGAIVLRQKWSRGQVEARLANLPPCLIGMEAWRGKTSAENLKTL